MRFPRQLIRTLQRPRKRIRSSLHDVQSVRSSLERYRHVPPPRSGAPQLLGHSMGVVVVAGTSVQPCCSPRTLKLEASEMIPTTVAHPSLPPPRIKRVWNLSHSTRDARLCDALRLASTSRFSASATLWQSVASVTENTELPSPVALQPIVTLAEHDRTVFARCSA